MQEKAPELSQDQPAFLESDFPAYLHHPVRANSELLLTASNTTSPELTQDRTFKDLPCTEFTPATASCLPPARGTTSTSQTRETLMSSLSHRQCNSAHQASASTSFNAHVQSKEITSVKQLSSLPPVAWVNAPIRVLSTTFEEFAATWLLVLTRDSAAMRRHT